MIRRTARLTLRPFEDRDRAPFASLNADAEVMEHFPAPLSRAESDRFVDRIEQKRASDGFCVQAVDADGLGFIGYCGLMIPGALLPFQPCVEIGWRLARRAWGRGYASEAARDALAHAFLDLALDEIVSFTATGNLRSMAVMERIGMIRDPDGDFLHPSIEKGHAVEKHVLYRIAKGDFG
ncbi:MAG: GNAT family N-acetyltransferase [Pseudomonadota bacterium]